MTGQHGGVTAQRVPNEPRKITHGWTNPLEAAIAAWPVTEDTTRPFAGQRPGASQERLVEPTRWVVPSRLEDHARKPVKGSMGPMPGGNLDAGTRLPCCRNVQSERGGSVVNAERSAHPSR
jgi:hypothetical protein